MSVSLLTRCSQLIFSRGNGEGNKRIISNCVHTYGHEDNKKKNKVTVSNLYDNVRCTAFSLHLEYAQLHGAMRIISRRTNQIN